MTRSNLAYFPKSIGSRIDRPLLIWIAPALLMLDALLTIAFATLVLASDNVYVSLAQDPSSTISNGALAALAAVNAAVDFAAAFGLLRQRTWGRHVVVAGHFVLLLLLFGVGVLAGAHPLQAANNLAGLMLGALFLSWYFYGRDSIRTYYQRLRSVRRRTSR